MSIKLVDSLQSMGDFPVAFANSIECADGTDLETKLSTLGTGGGAEAFVQLSQEEYDNLEDSIKLDGREFRTYDTGHIYKLGVEYGKDGVQISDNETVEDKTWSSKKTSDEIAKVETELLANYSIPLNLYMGINHYLAIKINIHNMNYSFNMSDRSGNIYEGAFFSYNGSFSIQITKVNNSSTKNGYILGFRQYKVSDSEIYLVAKVSDYNYINGVINTPSILKSNIEILVNDDSTLWDKGTDIVVKELATMDKVNASLGALCNKKIYCGEVTGTTVNGVISTTNPIGKVGNAIVTMQYASRNPRGYSITTQVTLSALNFYFRWHRESDGAEAYPPDGTEVVISYMIFY